MNRMGLGLAIGAGYLLGRTKKLKMAVAVGSLVAGKRLNLTPRAVLDLANQQLRDNPQFKEIGEQLRHDLRGVGKAASGAMVERQLDALADRLHGRTAEVRDQLAGVVPDTGDLGLGGRREEDEEPEEDEAPAEKAGSHRAGSDRAGSDRAEGGREERSERKAPARKAPSKKAAEKPPAKKSSAKPPVRKAPAKKAAQGRAAAKKTAGRARPKGGGDR
ncbi:DNA primase [Streptomyces shenzhenensis]|uniref:DNA primase n=1 Tax=Streptomyces shenzhenensis TaxID=943815 RepID=UPI0015F05047|nr:DNA primase [Streptomyces shenzhenensis]